MVLRFKPLLAVLLSIMFVAPGCLGDDNVGIPLDDFSYTADDGNEYSRDEMKGSDYLIHFSASWCSRCYKSMHNISDAIGDTDYLIMSVEKEGLSGLSTWHDTVDESNSTQDIIAPFMDGSELSEVLGVSAMPTIYLIDENGNIINIHEGDLTDHDEILKFLNQA
jgi:thioredoxin-related protein|tara:strand:+ start:102 stop:596 length:495 start_codon:yes stop_codon:yes gene_type:complete